MVVFKIREVLGGDPATKQDGTALRECLVRQALGAARSCWPSEGNIAWGADVGAAAASTALLMGHRRALRRASEDVSRSRGAT
jgi:hypothetical protein